MGATKKMCTLIVILEIIQTAQKGHMLKSWRLLFYGISQK